MSLSGNTKVGKGSPVKMSKPNGHTGGAKERQGNNFGKESFRSKVPTQAFKDNYDAIFGKK